MIAHQILILAVQPRLVRQSRLLPILVFMQSVFVIVIAEVRNDADDVFLRTKLVGTSCMSNIAHAA